MLAALRNALWLLILSAPLAGCSEEHQGPDSETHFLHTCSSDRECGADSCLCGVCTHACASVNECTASGALVCKPPADSSCGAKRVCDALCEGDEDCAPLGKGYACAGGRCRVPSMSKAQTEQPGPSEDAGTRDSRDSGVPDSVVNGLDAGSITEDSGSALDAMIDAGLDSGSGNVTPIDAMTVDANPGSPDAGSDSGLPFPRAEDQPCKATVDCADKLVCAANVCSKDPCRDVDCTAMPFFITGDPPCPAAATTRSPCASDHTCPDGLVCHVDDTCIAPGACDPNGVATLANLHSYIESPAALDASYVYGTDSSGQDASILRWSLTDYHEETLVHGKQASFADTSPLLVDGDTLYWIASMQVVGATSELWRLHVDGTSTPESLGPAGAPLAQDRGYLYAADVEATKLIRISKSAPDARATVFTAESGSLISLVAVNTTSILVAESAGQTAVVKLLDKQTLDAMTLPTETYDHKSYATSMIRGLQLDETYAYIQGNWFYRYELAATKLLAITTDYPCTLAEDGYLYSWSATGPHHPLYSIRIDMVTGDATDLVQVPVNQNATTGWGDPTFALGRNLYSTANDRLIRVVLPP